MAKQDSVQTLVSNMEVLSQNIKDLNELFSQASKRFEATPTETILEKLDKIYNQNEKIAGAILSLIELIRERLISPQHPYVQQKPIPTQTFPEEPFGIPARLPQINEPSMMPIHEPVPQGLHGLPPPPLPPGKKHVPLQGFEEHPMSAGHEVGIQLQPIQPIKAPQPAARMTMEERKRKLGL